MMQIPFISIPIIAVCCNAFLLLAFLAAKKNRLIYSFMLVLLAFMLWTGGSMCMRLQFFPGIYFWYEVSLLSLFTTPFLLYNFVCEFIEAKGYLLKLIWMFGTIIILILTHFEVFLKRPEFVQLGNGQAVFLYNTQWPIAIPCVFFFFILVSIAWVVFNQIKKKGMATPWLSPILAGMGILFVGNVLSIMPNNIFPWDTLSGIGVAFCFFYALYRKRLFKLTLLVSRGTVFLIAALVATGFLTYLTQPFETLINVHFPQFRGYRTQIIAMMFALITILFYKGIQKLIDKFFIKEEQAQAQKLKDFSLKVSKSLNLDEILKEVITVVKYAINVDKAYICMKDPQGENYRVACTASPLDSRDFVLVSNNPCAQWFEENDTCLVLKEFKKSTLYKSMWEQEKKQLSDLNIGCLVPLKCDNKLVGILLLSEKRKNGGYNFDDITFLESVQSIASIAINNANLYKNAYYEARIDHLTGLLNRKYFYEKLNEEFENCSRQSLALVILNLDDFKLYNQLYGNREGDMALQNVAKIITSCLGTSGIAARYGGKEFALIMPNCDTMQVFNMATEIKQQIANMHKGLGSETMKMITLSGGICVYPYSAANVKQLLENADMAVYNAKRSGKNKVLVYSMESTEIVTGQGTAKVTTGESVRKITSGKYSEYASTIYALTAAIDAKDHYTFNHSQKVAEYATTLAKAIGLNEDHVQIIYEAALLHDIGKISIPEHILSKPGRLTDEEYKIMQSHVENSIAIIRHLPSLDYVIPAAVAHHERWDGRGYPRGLKGEDVPIGARCLAIADAFDAMTAERPYKKPLSIEFAVNEIINQAGLQFDPQLAEVYVNLVREGKIHIGASA